MRPIDADAFAEWLRMHKYAYVAGAVTAERNNILDIAIAALSDPRITPTIRERKEENAAD